MNRRFVSPSVHSVTGNRSAPVWPNVVWRPGVFTRAVMATGNFFTYGKGCFKFLSFRPLVFSFVPSRLEHSTQLRPALRWITASQFELLRSLGAKKCPRLQPDDFDARKLIVFIV